MAGQHTETNHTENQADKATSVTPHGESTTHNPLNESLAQNSPEGTAVPSYANWKYDSSQREAKLEAARRFSNDDKLAVPVEGHDTSPSHDRSTKDAHVSQEATTTAEASVPTETATPAPTGTAPDSVGSSTLSLENFHKEMKWEQHGYRPVAHYRTVEDARKAGADTSHFETYVSVQRGGFTEQELAAIPDNAKQKNYYFGFAKQMLDSSEGIFTKKFWTSFDGIKKVVAAGIIKGEVEEIRLEAAEWLLSKRGNATVSAAAPEASTPQEARHTPDTPTTPEKSHDSVLSEALQPNAPSTEVQLIDAEVVQSDSAPRKTPTTARKRAVIDAEVVESASAPQKAATTAQKGAVAVETKTLDTAALQEIEKRIQSKLEGLRDRVIPETMTVRIDDPKSAHAIRQLQRYSEGFSAGIADQISKVHGAVNAVGELGLDQPQQGIVFKNRQEQALQLIDSLSFGQGELEKMVSDIKVPRGNKLPDSMKDAMSKSSDLLEGIKSDLEEARRLVANARRNNPVMKAEHDNTAQEGIRSQAGSVATMPRLGKDLTIDPRKLEAMGHAMVDANISDKDLNSWYKMVMSEFVKSHVGTFSKIRKEIYESRMDGSNMNEMQKEKFRFLADELGQEVNVSDLVQLDYSKFSLSSTEELDSRFRRVIDGSKFQKALNQMKTEFAAALVKELDKVPGTENTETTFVPFRRQKFEKSGISDYLAKN
jgi:hypothetical protein